VLDRLWRGDRDLLLTRRTVPQVVGGVLWVVGRANDLFGKAPAVRQKDAQRALWLKQPLSETGRAVMESLHRLDLEPVPRPWRLPSLEPAGDPAVLTSTTRRTLIRWRDRATEARRRYRADQVAAGLPAPDPGS
jgi:hypothetical protein